MLTKTGLSILVLAALIFAGSFVGVVALNKPQEGITARAVCSPLVIWLDLTDEQIAEINTLDGSFADDLNDARTKLNEARSALAMLFEQAETTDEQLCEGVEAVIAAHNALERRVAEHLILVRKHLTPTQQGRLFALLAEEVRQCCKRAGFACVKSSKPQCQPAPDCSRCPNAGPICPIPVQTLDGAERPASEESDQAATGD